MINRFFFLEVHIKNDSMTEVMAKAKKVDQMKLKLQVMFKVLKVRRNKLHANDCLLYVSSFIFEQKIYLII